MKCPVCRQTPLQELFVEPWLKGHQCKQCEGLFIAFADYERWRSTRVVALPERPDSEAFASKPEPALAKQCPSCYHVLLPYKIIAGDTFTVDHCGACNSMWFDRDEWIALKWRQLHTDLQEAFAEPWQRRLRTAERRARMAAIYRDKFGEIDYAEVQRVKAWLETHPQRQALCAYLISDDPYSA